MASEFFDSYRDPRWQKKRLEVMSAAGFACEECGTDTATLNVHHKFYLKDRLAWEYTNEQLVCLCEPCHDGIHLSLHAVKNCLSHVATRQIPELLGYIKGLLLKSTMRDHRIRVEDDDECGGLAAAFSIPLRGGYMTVLGGLFEAPGEKGRWMTREILDRAFIELTEQNEHRTAARAECFTWC